jgi:hypothetical protein
MPDAEDWALRMVGASALCPLCFAAALLIRDSLLTVIPILGPNVRHTVLLSHNIVLYRTAAVFFFSRSSSL